MSETDHRTEPHVSTEELRAALVPRGAARRNPVLVSEHSEDAENEILELRTALESARADETELRTELDGHRRAIDAARGDAAELRAELAQSKAEARERRNSLDKLANAGFFSRRKVLNDLRAKGAI